MIRVDVNVPPICRRAGFLYWVEDVAGLGEDMVEVELPSGVLIDAGWYPEGSVDGSYKVKACWRLTKLVDDHYFADINDAARFVEDLTNQLLRPDRVVPVTNTCVHDLSVRATAGVPGAVPVAPLEYVLGDLQPQ
jgi:hypothetical protein